MYGVYKFFEIIAKDRPDSTFLVEDESRLSYCCVRQMTNRLAYGLKGLGLGGGSKVGYVLFNNHKNVITFFALQKLGCFMVPFNYRFSAQEMSEYISSLECEYFIYGGEFAQMIEQIRSEHPTVVFIAADGGVCGDAEYASLMDNDASEWAFFEDMPPKAPAIGILTGGTTGRSKAAVHSQHSILMQQLTRQAWLYYENYVTGPLVYLHISPLFHIGGIGPMFNIIATGGTLIFAGNKFDPEALAAVIEREKVTDMVLIPPNLAQSIKDAGVHKRYDLSSVRYIGIGGSAITPSHVRVVYEVFPNARCDLMWSHSEHGAFIGQMITAADVDADPSILKSVGKPKYFTEVKIVRDDGTEADVSEVGELYVRSEDVMLGYFGQSESPFVDGWLPTGDLFKKDAAGKYYFVDRKKDMIKSGGENVYSAEVESVIKQYPGVSEVAVVGLLDKFYGEAVSAAIVLGPDALLTESDILDFCKSKIASYKKPRHIFFVRELPKSGAGKVQKAALKEMLCEML